VVLVSAAIGSDFILQSLIAFLGLNTQNYLLYETATVRAVIPKDEINHVSQNKGNTIFRSENFCLARV
jgi:hypothetical protein